MKQDITGDCLVIKLEGDLQSWIKYVEKIRFWNEIF